MAVLTPGIGTGKPVNAAASDDPFDFTGVAVDNSHDDNSDPKNVSAEQFGYWLQNAMLKLLDVAAKGGVAVPVRNETGATITKGTNVYISSWSSAQSRGLISKADANYVAKRATFVLKEDIAHNANGRAYPFSDVTGLDTSGASSVGSKVYLSGTPGAFVYADPAGATVICQEVGVVTVKHATTGAIRFYPGAGVFTRQPVTLADNSVVAAKLAFTATNKIVGRSSAGAGAGQEITCTPLARSILACFYEADILSILSIPPPLDWISHGAGNDTSSMAALPGALGNDTSGLKNNIAIGENTLLYNNSGANNVAIGQYAGLNNYDGYENIAIGSMAGHGFVSGFYNIAIGAGALLVCDEGQENIAIGEQALGSNLDGISNLAIGPRALNQLSGGVENVAVGMDAGYTCQGYYNTMLGASTGGGSGNYNTFIGHQAGSGMDSGTNNTCLGALATPSSDDVDDEITLGDDNIDTLRCAVTSITSLSDVRDKTDIVDLAVGLEFVKKLRPRVFKWQKRSFGKNIEKQQRKRQKKDFGFVAQELDLPGYEWLGLVYKSNPDRWETSPGKMIPILVRAIQELSARVEALEARG
jgi:hypothetical protein